MAENVRDVIRAAQAAELGGDKRRAIELFQRAAELCRRGGNRARAEQLLRYALRLDPSRTDLEEALRRLEAGESEPSPPIPVVSSDEEEDEDDVHEGATWEIEEDSSTLQDALREASLAVDRRANPVGLAVKVMRSAVLTAESVGPRREEPPAPPAVSSPSSPEREGMFIERGPTRADPALEAWCSFCCRPRLEVGPLVAGPAGAFICAACIGESSSLLGGVTARAPSARPRASRPITQELLGQAEARARLESGLAAGVRRVLVLGPEGSGKSTWLRALVEAGQGEAVTPESIDRASVEATLLVEDVDRLPSAGQAALGAFLSRHPQRTVVMSARGGAVVPGPELVSDSGRLFVPTTASLSEATRGALSLLLLEQVQLLVVLETPGVELLREIARRQLAAREDIQLSDEALTALAQEAARSPRTGHELKALLARIPPGSWRRATPGPGKGDT
ncbi:tetratricopeptide repeat/ClpX C4-type zinc finger protein [Cystobacter fuscus DSM 2262]|uniref:Tetratricopeptide repeat/ClpX C4-type zinc finger protein n=1 Tax=Cystobacter fuscus (strain ATCC 25194 / DSM 2262 / NBRC 100088 / M29) TaxID=1242864 RepID=S9PHY2_CYSF2|nr:ClpX C4-type zinc finger protein [Cystobacter fuscus]EPX62007.1 tetratricopeptide repeat/ClpX C4-type zinc finger protein [Cystobacter fuscus DSM 2262]